ncbi:MAG: hypothetical protein JKY70_04235 [Mucilaginibacter sp.]|nr:hypothetical protein [Mucilaginibacter sp.]
MMKILVMTFLMLSSIQGYAQNTRLDSLVAVLKNEIRNKNKYDLQTYQRISHLKTSIRLPRTASFEEQFHYLSLIFNEYQSFKFDSAYTWVNKMVALSLSSGNKEKLFSAQTMKGYILMSSGYFKEAFELLSQVDTSLLANSQKSELYYLRARLNSAIGNYVDNKSLSSRYFEQSDKDFKIAAINNTPNHFEETVDLAFKNAGSNDKKYTAGYFYDFINSGNLTAHGLAMVATRLSYAYTGDDKAIFLALAAINDIRSSTKETSAIMMLGQEMYKAGKLTDAYLFIQEAIGNASYYGARGHAIQAGELLPLIASKMIAQKQHDKDRLLIWLLLVAVTAVIMSFALYIYRKQLRRIKASEQLIIEKNDDLKRVNHKLKEASRVKEELIGLIFKDSSSHLDEMDKVTRKTQHNLKLGKYAEANTALKTIDIDKRKTNLYETLDNIFLTLFPNFPDAFNALLKDDHQIHLKEGASLTPTLRIFALMRLGISDMQTVARILNYSITTVYTYKTKVKARALISPEEFERQVMNIEFLGE